jgi:REP element-mobilizing transposase RayT
MIDRAWKEIALCHPDVTTDVHIVMPDHVHGIIMIGTNDLPRHAALSQVIQWFKTVTVKRYGEGVRKLGWQPYKGQLWQRSFHDHIIRNDHEFKNRHEYIEANPWRWVESRDAARNLP